ncbi:hypothetical protein FSP39_013706 [Pinctada imbricata]|uniref:G-protein coupled receptors family 1 profile domain-containing protein n=1 Tax=Pinctada imbricata TaxID=66713 RepID=A0AA88XUM7_PINIB|nr:hypothetical protein FSP39_013706 [Pinctada imbricata]
MSKSESPIQMRSGIRENKTTSVTVSVLTLTAISVERYFAICKPWRERLTSRRILVCIMAIWITGFIVSVPDLVYYRVHNTFDEEVTTYLRYCSRDWSETENMAYHLFMLIVLYTMPICLMAYTYTVISRQLWRKDLPGTAESENRSSSKMLPLSSPETQLKSRQRAAKMLMTIVILFAVSYLPVHVLNIIRYTTTFRQVPAYVIVVVFLLSHILCYFNSAINPLIYNFMSAKFRKEFRRSIRQLWGCKCRQARDHHIVMSSARTRSSLHRLERYELNTVSTKQGWANNSNIVKNVQNPQEKYG